MRQRVEHVWIIGKSTGTVRLTRYLPEAYGGVCKIRKIYYFGTSRSSGKQQGEDTRSC